LVDFQFYTSNEIIPGDTLIKILGVHLTLDGKSKETFKHADEQIRRTINTLRTKYIRYNKQHQFFFQSSFNVYYIIKQGGYMYTIRPQITLVGIMLFTSFFQILQVIFSVSESMNIVFAMLSIFQLVVVSIRILLNILT
jgi:hypothetical protein